MGIFDTYQCFFCKKTKLVVMGVNELRFVAQDDEEISRPYKQKVCNKCFKSFGDIYERQNGNVSV